MSDDKSHRAPDTTGTDIGEPRPKLFGGARAVVERIDTKDPDQVFDLANVLKDADTRRLMQATHDELRAIAGYAVSAGVIASHACHLVDLTLRQAPADEIAAAFEALAQIVRPS
jgi:hypothetical protein